MRVNDNARAIVEGISTIFPGEMTVASSDGSIACKLTNVTPVTSVATNTVYITCTAPKGSGTITLAVVSVT